MTQYDLSHLTQIDQELIGPIQDDEALLLYGLIRCMRLKTVVELGGGTGYSATNFLAAVGARGVVYTVDVCPQIKLADNHIPILSCAGAVDMAQFPQGVDLVFYDTHNLPASLSFHERALAAGVITNRTLLALHDTGLHPRQVTLSSYFVGNGWLHQPVERQLVTEFIANGWHALCAHADNQTPYRHGLTVMQHAAVSAELAVKHAV